MRAESSYLAEIAQITFDDRLGAFYRQHGFAWLSQPGVLVYSS
jgi:hypothetical protein